MNELRLEKSNEEEVIWRDIRSFNRRPAERDREKRDAKSIPLKIDIIIFCY